MADLFTLSFGVAPSQGMAAQMFAQNQMVANSLDQNTLSMLDSMSMTTVNTMNFGTKAEIERVSSMINGVIDSRQITMASSMFDLQTANNSTARMLLAMPAFSTMHRLGQIEAYGMEYKPVENEMLLRRITSGIGGLNGKDYKITWHADNHILEDYNELSAYDRLSIIRNNNLALQAVAEDHDPTSTRSNNF